MFTMIDLNRYHYHLIHAMANEKWPVELYDFFPSRAKSILKCSGEIKRESYVAAGDYPTENLQDIELKRNI